MSLDIYFTEKKLCPNCSHKEPAPEANGWISVKNDLPKENDYYLVIKVGYVPYVAMYTRSVFQWTLDGKICEPTHWMPLPSPPLTNKTHPTTMEFKVTRKGWLKSMNHG